MCKNSGFTLLRLLIVILIVVFSGVFVVLAWQQYRLSVAKKRYVQGVEVVDGIWRAQQLHFMTNATYVPGFAGLKIRLPPGKKKAEMLDEEVWETESSQFSIRAEKGVGSYVCVKIKNTDVPAPQYVRYFNGPNAQCYAPRTSKLWNKVCLAYGGKLASADSFFNIYDL